MLEANAIPGLTETSLLPLAAEAAGIGFDAFVPACSTSRSSAPRPSVVLAARQSLRASRGRGTP